MERLVVLKSELMLTPVKALMMSKSRRTLTLDHQRPLRPPVVLKLVLVLKRLSLVMEEVVVSDRKKTPASTLSALALLGEASVCLSPA